MTKRLRWEGTTLLTMYVVYAAMMVCRNTVVVVSPALIQDPTLGMDTAQYGQMMAYGSLGGVVGKLTLGLVVDRLGGRRMLLLTLALVAASTVSLTRHSHRFPVPPAWAGWWEFRKGSTPLRIVA